jgi:hypothetical protein
VVEHFDNRQHRQGAHLAAKTVALLDEDHRHNAAGSIFGLEIGLYIAPSWTKF